MKLNTVILAALVAALLIMPATAQEERPLTVGMPDVFKNLLEERAPAVVALKFVLKVQITARGQTQDREESREVRGILIDELGLCLTSNTHFGLPNRIRQAMRRQNVEISAVPADMKVLFGNEAEEYDAQLVLKDTKLGIAFVQILDLKGRKVKHVDLSRGNQIQHVGQQLYAVGRLGRAFDCAPRVAKTMVSALVEKPRKMWGFAGSVTVGLPVYDISGTPVGIVAIQEGSEGVAESSMNMMGPDAGMAPFILPLEAIDRSVKKAMENGAMALEQAAEAVEDQPEDQPEGQPADQPEEKPADEPEEKPDDKQD